MAPRHALDPQAAPEVLAAGSWPPMRWERWASWQAGDPRWHTDLVDTTGRTAAESAAQVDAWIARVRAARTDGPIP